MSETLAINYLRFVEGTGNSKHSKDRLIQNILREALPPFYFILVMKYFLLSKLF